MQFLCGKRTEMLVKKYKPVISSQLSQEEGFYSSPEMRSKESENLYEKAILNEAIASNNKKLRYLDSVIET